ncbi:MAG: SCP2 sterol-binding domain-containing protein [Anaerolineae bacterium]|nr:SCP2 sterol-binding domain-containing protein [Anaerolineae bacterium]
MNVADVFDEMVRLFPAEKAAGLRARFLFRLSGEQGGEWTVTIADQTCNVTPGSTEKPDVTFLMDAADFLKMVRGELQPVVAFMQGKLKLQGDMNKAMKLQELFASIGTDR